MTKSKQPPNHYQHKGGTSNKTLQASYNNGANEIVELAPKKSDIKNLNVLINLAMVTSDTKPVPKEPKTFNNAWDHPNA